MRVRERSAEAGNPRFALVFWPFPVGEGVPVFVPVDGIGFQMEAKAVVGAGEVHFILFGVAPIGEIAAASNDFAPGV